MCTHLLSQLSSYVAQPRGAIKTVSLQSSIPQHLHHLGVLLTVLLEHQLPLVVLVFILTPPSVLTSLSYENSILGIIYQLLPIAIDLTFIFRHGYGFALSLNCLF